MEKFITDKRTGLTYELVGDYYLVTDDEGPKFKPIGIWGQHHRRYLRQNKRCFYQYLFMTGKLDGHLREIDRAANEMFAQLTERVCSYNCRARNFFSYVNNLPASSLGASSMSNFLSAPRAQKCLSITSITDMALAYSFIRPHKYDYYFLPISSSGGYFQNGIGL